MKDDTIIMDTELKRMWDKVVIVHFTLVVY